MPFASGEPDCSLGPDPGPSETRSNAIIAIDNERVVFSFCLIFNQQCSSSSKEVDMKARHFLTILAIIALAFPAFTIAGHYHGHYGSMQGNWDMTALDTNEDGVLTFEEFSAPNVKKWRSGFEMIDTSGDGNISTEEWRAFLEVHGVKSEK